MPAKPKPSISPTLKKIGQYQKEDPAILQGVNAWLQEEIHEDLGSLQALHADKEGSKMPEPEGGWPAGAKFEEAIQEEKEKIYSRVLSLCEEGFFDSDGVEAPKPHKSKTSPGNEVVEEVVDPFEVDFETDEPEEEAPITPPDDFEEQQELKVRNAEEPLPPIRTSTDASRAVKYNKAELLEQLLGGEDGVTEERVIELIEEHATKIVDERFAKLKKAFVLMDL